MEQGEDEKVCRAIFFKIGCRTDSRTNKIRFYYVLKSKSGVDFIGEFNTTYKTPEEAWKKLRKFAEKCTLVKEKKIIEEKAKLIQEKISSRRKGVF